MTLFRAISNLAFGSLLLFLATVATAKSLEEEARDLRLSAETFRRVAAENFVESLQYYSTPANNLTLIELGNDLWPGTDPATGWSLYFSTALVSMSHIESDKKTVTFVHPWSETLLTTLWQKDPEGALRMTDATMLITGLLDGEEPPYPAVRMWPKLESYGPIAVGLRNAQITVGVESMFDVFSQEDVATLDSDLLQGIGFAAAIQIMEYQADLLPVLRSPDGNAAQARGLWNALSKDVTADKTQFDGGFSQQMKTLSLLDERIWNSFIPVAYRSTNTASLLMLASVENPDLYIAMQQDHSPDGATLKQLDLFSFHSSYGLFRSIEGVGQ